MKNLNRYVKETNDWRSFWKHPPLVLDSAKDRQLIAQMLEGAMSPENLTCDGEFRGEELIKKARYLQACCDELEELDPSIVFDSCTVI